MDCGDTPHSSLDKRFKDILRSVIEQMARTNLELPLEANQENLT